MSKIRELPVLSVPVTDENIRAINHAVSQHNAPIPAMKSGHHVTFVLTREDEHGLHGLVLIAGVYPIALTIKPAEKTEGGEG